MENAKQTSPHDEPVQRNEISVAEYTAVHFRRTMKAVCRFYLTLLERLPANWQRRLWRDRVQEWEARFTVAADSQKDWLWEVLFWDTRRRVIVFSTLGFLLLLGIGIFFLLVFRESAPADTLRQKGFSEVLKAAGRGDAAAQFQIGRSFYYGKSVSKDVDLAVLWLSKAARAGHLQAAELLQKILVEQDIRNDSGVPLWNSSEKPFSGGE